MKRLITLTSTMLLATSAFASSSVLNVSEGESILAGTFDSKAAAYEAGHQLSDSIIGKSQAELKNEVTNIGYSTIGHVNLANFDVKVSELATEHGEAKYSSIVNYDYQYRARQKD